MLFIMKSLWFIKAVSDTVFDMINAVSQAFDFDQGYVSREARLPSSDLIAYLVRISIFNRLELDLFDL